MQRIINSILKATLLAFICSEISQNVSGTNLRSVSEIRNLEAVGDNSTAPTTLEASSDDAAKILEESGVDASVVDVSVPAAPVVGFDDD